VEERGEYRQAQGFWPEEEGKQYDASNDVKG
jgi:hypothetical protein